MKSINKLGLSKNLVFFQIYRVVFFTWHLPLTHMSTDPGLHGVPSITLEASLAEKRYRGFFGLQNNEHGWPVTKKARTSRTTCRTDTNLEIKSKGNAKNIHY